MARTKQQNEAMKEERNQKILSTALNLFATRGLAATRISDIAKAADMSQGLVYHYYSSKEQIFTRLIRSAFEKLNGACAMLLKDSAPPHEKISLALRELIRGLREDADTARTHLLIATATASKAIPDEARAIIEKENTYAYTVIETIIKQGQKLGTVKKHDAAQLSTLFWTTIIGLAIHRSSHGTKSLFPDISILTGLFLEE